MVMVVFVVSVMVRVVLLFGCACVCVALAALIHSVRGSLRPRAHVGAIPRPPLICLFLPLHIYIYREGHQSGRRNVVWHHVLCVYLLPLRAISIFIMSLLQAHIFLIPCDQSRMIGLPCSYPHTSGQGKGGCVLQYKTSSQGRHSLTSAAEREGGRCQDDSRSL